MGGLELQDRFSRGLGAAARAAGLPYDLFRPRGHDDPLKPEKRVLRLPAVFDGGDPGYRRPRGYERALRGTFDADCTKVGDYLVGSRGTLFVASLQPLARPLCVLTNAVLRVMRAAGPGEVGLNSYGGIRDVQLREVLSCWPAQALASGPGRSDKVPDNTGGSRWSMLLPLTPVPLMASDILQDAEKRRFVVQVAERTELGWRLDVRLAGV